jgi:hypothetical protein
MAPHLRALHPCSPANLASEILRLYLVSAKGDRTAVCDIHSYGGAVTPNWHEFWYTGPGKKSVTAISHQRSEAQVAAYERHHEVALENDIAEGGRATLVFSRERQSFDIWMFGPLSFLDRAYGSLIVELANYIPRKIFSKRDKDWHMEWWAEFPKIPAKFNACKILQTGFHLQARARAAPKVADLKDAGAGAVPAILRPFVRAEWSVESRIAAQTNCALYEQEGV